MHGLVETSFNGRGIGTKSLFTLSFSQWVDVGRISQELGSKYLSEIPNALFIV